ncbi:hypothetical protein F5Y11DRAFT_144506 [Daldinia sp. FL1419]|nr:hypothetical protein F5Y11DRAFT_144506 [Daldinia sp. FL1419]
MREMDVLSLFISFVPGVSLFLPSDLDDDEKELFEPTFNGFNEQWESGSSSDIVISIGVNEFHNVVYDSRGGFSVLASELLNFNSESCYRLEGYDFLGPDKPGATGKKKKFTSYLGDLAQFMKSPDRKWVRTVRAVQCAADNKQFSISCGIITSKSVRRYCALNPELSHTTTKRFALRLKSLDDLYSSLRNAGNVKPLFILQCQHASLNIFTDFLELMALTYTHRRSRDFDPRLSGLRRWQLEAIMNDSQLYREFSDYGNELVATIESLLDLVLVLDGINTSRSMHDIKLLMLEKTLRGCCKDFKLRLTRFSDGLDHSLKFLSLARELNQSGNVQNLTLLATIFLPLSLAAGVLSMQSRFKDLGSLLYDFFGVVVLLAAIVALLLGIMFILANVKELESRMLKYKIYRQIGRRFLLGVFVLMLLTFGALVLASFIVGMFKDVVLGASILGYGTLVLVFGPIVIGILAPGIKLVIDSMKEIFSGLISILSRKVDRNQKKQKDVERNPEPRKIGPDPKNKDGDSNLVTGIQEPDTQDGIPPQIADGKPS